MLTVGRQTGSKSITNTVLSSTTSAIPSCSPDVPTGALAGAVVGCALGGLIFGFAAAWFVLRRRWKKSSGRRAGSVAVVDTSHEPKEHVRPTVATGSYTNDIQLDQFLLSATPDREIGAELQSLGDLIQQHVENHYHLGPAPVGASVSSQGLVKLGFTQGSGLSAEAVAALCAQPESRQVGIRHVISEIVFRSIDAHSRSRLSMLPVPVAAFLQSIPPAEQQDGNPHVISVAVSKWRQLSAILLHPSPLDRSPLPISEPVVSHQALALANALNTFLHYFVAPDEASRQEQTSHLQAVIVECTKLGYVLFSQPSDWQFVFKVGGVNTRQQGVVVCPGLNKLSPPDGSRRYSSPRRVVEPVLIPS
ncbi:hypothetical protein B0J13DRAFT_487778 [Dactylonectria estremocensis]|uniref:Uncharacterized protein n=1 Tax=Dactylonectria estremocensis TaxID=1079267 RepID=A0A9P9ID93_9HYPO|nr:hypothetical protein B0J13DRAFT_487778 [Dactylonectria estremocensis]